MKVKTAVKETFRFIGALLALARAVMVIGMFVIGALSVYLIYETTQVTVNQYNETLTWDGTAYNIPLADIEPALVANRLDKDIVTAAAAWDDLETYVKSLNGDGIPDREEAHAILDEAVKWQEIYDLESYDIDRLSLYLRLEEAIDKAYATLDITDLQQCAQELYDIELEEKTVSGQRYMERMQELSADFEDAGIMMANTVLSIGKVENGIWTIPYTYTRSDLTEALEQIEAMQRFQELESSANVLSDIADVLNYNKNARDYFEYQSFMESIENLRRSDYVPVSSIYTYGQALEFGCIVNPVYMNGYTISMNSPVTGIYYEGRKLAGNQYVRKGTELTATINEVYDMIVIEEPVVEEIPWDESNNQQNIEGEWNNYE